MGSWYETAQVCGIDMDAPTDVVFVPGFSAPGGSRGNGSRPLPPRGVWVAAARAHVCGWAFYVTRHCAARGVRRAPPLSSACHQHQQQHAHVRAPTPQVVMSGTSAGGLTTYLHAEYFRTRLPPSAKLWAGPQHLGSEDRSDRRKHLSKKRDVCTCHVL